MICPKCSGDVRVIDTASDSSGVVRRRKCLECEHIFYTYEFYTDKHIGAQLIEKFKRGNRITKTITKT